MEFVKLFNLPLNANIIDIGGGDIHFVDALLKKGYKNIWVLDISATAIQKAKKRLGEKAKQVNQIIADVIEFIPPVQFDFWHDRAAFHILTTQQQIYKYTSIAEDAIKQNGFFFLEHFQIMVPINAVGYKFSGTQKFPCQQDLKLHLKK